MSEIDLRFEKKKIDNFLITSSSTIIAGYLILLSLSQEIPFHSNVASIIAISALIFSILFTLWHKYRSAIKGIMVDKEYEKFLDRFKSMLEEYSDMVKDTGKTKVQRIIKEALEEKDFKDEEEAKKYLNSEDLKLKIERKLGLNDDLDSPLTTTIAENTVRNIEEISTKVYEKPLDEKLSKTKFILDKIAEKLRYLLFTVGLIAFLTSIILNTIDV